jgi:hypothetical protein
MRLLAGDDLTIVLFFVGTAVSLGCAAMSTAGWRHPALIITLFGLAAICFVFGAGWPAIKEISPPALSAPVHQIATSPVAWFVVLVLGMIASILFPRRRHSRFVESKPRELVAPSNQPSKSAERVEPVKTNEPAEDKIFIDVSPIYLTDLYRGRTSIQADSLAAVYKGKWIAVTGKVNDISDAFGGVTIFIVCDDSRMVTAGFPVDKKDKISHMAHGAIISLHGKILDINSYVVKLEECDLS